MQSAAPGGPCDPGGAEDRSNVSPTLEPFPNLGVTGSLEGARPVFFFSGATRHRVSLSAAPMTRLALLGLVCSGCAHSVDLRSLDALVVDAQARLEVPGVAVAVVRDDGEVLYERATGAQELGRAAPVTRETLFLLGSVSKPLTTMLEARLVDEGRFDWSTKVTTLLPDFALGDAALTDALALWHMSCGCTGMPRRDLEHLFEFAHVTPEQRLASMRDMQPTTPLGAAFQYSNLMFAAGGYAVAHALRPAEPLKTAWPRLLHDELFAPAGLRTATADFDEALRLPHASPHALDLDGHTRVLPVDLERNVETIAPAGAVWASLDDLERYAVLELRRGRRADGTRVVSQAQVEARWRRRTGTDDDGYGLGVDVMRPALGHDGGSMGFGTSLLLLPEQHLALVVLTNVRNGGGALQLPFNAAVKERFLSLALGTPDDAEATLARALEARPAERPAHPRRIDPSLAGRYASQTLGEVEVVDDVLDAGEWKVRFEVDGDELLIVDPPFAGTRLGLRREGDEVQLVIPDEVAPVVFRRVP